MTTAVPFQNQLPIFNKVGTIAELVRMTPEELQKYNISIDSYRTNLSVMKNERAEGRAEGIAEGRAEGIAEGRAEGIMNVASNMKALGLDNELIARATGMTIDEIKSLFKE